MSDETAVSPISLVEAPARRRKTFYDEHEAKILGFSTIAVLVVIWELCWRAGWISPLFFSGPSAIAAAFVEMAKGGQLAADVAYTAKNFLIGLLLGIVVAVPLGIVLGWYRRAFLLTDPLITIFYATPRIALYPLFIIWFGIGSQSKIFIVFLSAMMPVLINVIAGVRNIDPDILKAARAFCATDRQIFYTIALPSSVPFILTGIRQGIAHGLIGAIIAELFAGSEGIGFMISYAGQTFATDKLLVGVVCTALMGLILTAIAERIQRHFQKWRPAHVGGR